MHGDAVVVLFIDLDRFKVINDRIGHRPATRCSVAVAARLRACAARRLHRPLRRRRVRPPARRRRIASTPTCWRSRIHAVLRTTHRRQWIRAVLDGERRRCPCAPDHDTSETLLRDADSAHVRGQGRWYGRGTTVVRRDVARAGHATSRLGRTHCATHSTTEFRLLYQPVVVLSRRGARSASRHCCDGTIRRSGCVPPGRLHPASPRTLGSSSRSAPGSSREAVADSGLAPELGIDDLWITVNVSTRQLATPSLSPTICRAARGHRAVPAVLPRDHRDGTDPRRRPRRSNARGRCATSAFAAGDRRLRHRVLVAHLPQASSRSTCSRSIVVRRRARHRPERHVDRAHDPEPRIGPRPHRIAEGVETELQLDALREYGCELGQGYFWSPGLPPDELVVWLDRTSAHARNR